MRPPLPDEKLDITDDLDTGGMSEIDGPMGLRMRQRHAWRQNEDGLAVPVDRPEIGNRYSLRCRLGHAIRIVIPGRDLGATGDERSRRGEARAAEAEESDLLSVQRGD